MADHPPPPSFIALIPAYNECRHIGRVVRQTTPFLPVLVVDDGSQDDTAAQAEAAGARVFRQVPNQGKGAALMNGFRQALAMGVEGVIMLDADGQHNPAEIPAFLAIFAESQADLIIGQRDFHAMPFLRRAANTFGAWLFSRAVGQPIPDNQSGYRLLSRRMIEATLSSRETSFEFEVEMIVRCIRRGYKLAWAPISTIYGDEKSHIQPLHHVMSFLRVVAQARKAVQEKEIE